ncbi:MAG: hydroxysqualene dehydroxylase HpnE [Pseudomonadota bacterium]
MAARVATKVAVIGAGYAGLASAVELAEAGVAVEVFEASHTLGGRARAVTLDSMTVDNGAHILVGAYRETLRLMEKVGADRTALKPLKREFLHLEFPGQVKVAAPNLPAPLHLGWALLTARGLSFKDKIAAIRFMRAQQARNFRLPEDLSAADLFSAHRQPERVRRFLWEPLCLAALNTPVASASAQVFLNVLRDSLAADRAASDLLLPATDFSSLFPEPAARFIASHGGRVVRGTRIRTLAELNELGRFDHKVIAVAPYHLAALLPEIAARFRFDWQPIATCYLAYPGATLLPFPMIGLDNGYAQWIFDRGALCGQPGILAAVISGTGPWQELDHDALAASIHAQIAALLPGLRPPLKHWVIEEKRATFACTPSLERPPTATGLPNVWLAGDYVAGDYPATLEGAVRSGVAAARSILRETSGHQS